MTLKLLEMTYTCDNLADMNYLRNLCLANKVEMRTPTNMTIAETSFPNAPYAVVQLIFSTSAQAAAFRNTLTTAGHVA